MPESIKITPYMPHLCGGPWGSWVAAASSGRPLLPGALGNPESLATESFSTGLLEGPQYTRPPVFAGLEVPEVLRSGDHGAVAEWRADRARELTRCRRPDLLEPDSDPPGGRRTAAGEEES